jgi:poly(3-hydroxybutyrate) depolymerase
MNKKDIKYIRQLAERLPDVYEQTVSGFYEDYDEEGKMVLYPNIQNNPINHTRRMRKAYEKLGLDGIKSYLDMIHGLQKERKV